MSRRCSDEIFDVDLYREFCLDAIADLLQHKPLKYIVPFIDRCKNSKTETELVMLMSDVRHFI